MIGIKNFSTLDSYSSLLAMGFHRLSAGIFRLCKTKEWTFSSTLLTGYLCYRQNHSIEHLKNQGVCWEKCLFAGFLCSFPGVFYDFGTMTSPTDLSVYANHADPGESCAGASLHGILFSDILCLRCRLLFSFRRQVTYYIYITESRPYCI